MIQMEIQDPQKKDKSLYNDLSGSWEGQTIQNFRSYSGTNLPKFRQEFGELNEHGLIDVSGNGENLEGSYEIEGSYNINSQYLKLSQKYLNSTVEI